MTPAAKRQAVAHACAVHEVSKRWACEALGVNRSSVRYRSRRACDAAVRLCIRGLVAQLLRQGRKRKSIQAKLEFIWEMSADIS